MNIRFLLILAFLITSSLMGCLPSPESTIEQGLTALKSGNFEIFQGLLRPDSEAERQYGNQDGFRTLHTALKTQSDLQAGQPSLVSQVSHRVLQGRMKRITEESYTLLITSGPLTLGQAQVDCLSSTTIFRHRSQAEYDGPTVRSCGISKLVFMAGL